MLTKRPESDNTGSSDFTKSELTKVASGALARADFSRATIARFHTKYQKADGCWLWTAGRFSKGYGMVNLGRDARGKQHTAYAHRVAYVIAVGPIPAGAIVMHVCDNPPCVNPAHLRLGTQADNIRDAFAKGRHPKTRKRAA